MNLTVNSISTRSRRMTFGEKSDTINYVNPDIKKVVEERQKQIKAVKKANLIKDLKACRSAFISVVCAGLYLLPAGVAGDAYGKWAVNREAQGKSILITPQDIAKSDIVTKIGKVIKHKI